MISDLTNPLALANWTVQPGGAPTPFNAYESGGSLYVNWQGVGNAAGDQLVIAPAPFRARASRVSRRWRWRVFRHASAAPERAKRLASALPRRPSKAAVFLREACEILPAGGTRGNDPRYKLSFGNLWAGASLDFALLPLNQSKFTENPSAYICRFKFLVKRARAPILKKPTGG